MTNFRDLIKKAGNDFAHQASEGTDVFKLVDTGSYSLNALISGQIFAGGMPNNKVIALAGEESTGKSFYALSIAANFQKMHPKAVIVCFESEGALDNSQQTTDMLKARGIDPERFHILPVVTVQDFRTQCARILDGYLETPETERDPMLMILDSLGNLSTNKEVADIAEGKDTRDMTRTQIIRGAFRVLTLKMNRARVPMIVTNHTYEVTGAYVPTKEMCLVAGTGVMMADGNKESIENLEVGDELLTLNGPGKVTATHQYQGKEVYKLTFDDGSTVSCTGEHKFLVDGEWRTVASLLEEVSGTSQLNISVAHIEDDGVEAYGQQVQQDVSETD